MKTALKLVALISLLLAFTSCGGKQKPDPQKDLPPSEVKADFSKAQQMDDNSVMATPVTGETTYEGADIANARRATEAKSEDIPKQDEIPFADKNTQFVEDGMKAPTDEDASAAATTEKAMNAVKGKSTLKKSTAKNARAAGKGSVASDVSAEKAQGWLKNGNTRFMKHRLRTDGQSAADRARLVKSQHPHSVIFACSDSRVPPELIFDQKLGEIFVVRTDRLAVDSAVVESLEKAVYDFGTQLLVVLSNSGCGVAANKVADELITKSAPLAEKVNMGGLKIVPATYDLQTGIVRFE